VISEYVINKELFRDCDLLKYPTKKEAKTKTFDLDNSPFVFSNRLSYSLSKDGEIKTITNGFYVNEITNYPSEEVVGWRYKEYCGQKAMSATKYYKKKSPDMFYINYIEDRDYWDH
jgi:hypothetical protein